MGYKAQKIYVGDNLVRPEAGGDENLVEISFESYSFPSGTSRGTHTILTSQPGVGDSVQLRQGTTSYYGGRVEQLWFNGSSGGGNQLSTQYYHDVWTRMKYIVNMSTGDYTMIHQKLDGSETLEHSGQSDTLKQKDLYFILSSGDRYYPRARYDNVVIKKGGRIIFSDDFSTSSLKSGRENNSYPTNCGSTNYTYSPYLNMELSGTSGAVCGILYKIKGPTYFDFGDWTNSQWTVGPGSSAQQGTITKTSTYISFYNGSNNTSNYLSQYPIDGTKDFLLEFRGNIPNTSLSYHGIGITTVPGGNNIDFHTNRESTYRDKIWCETYDGTTTVRQGGETNPGTADYFIKKEGNTLTMGRNGATKYTKSSFPFASTYYLNEGVYRATATIYTAKLTYL